MWMVEVLCDIGNLEDKAILERGGKVLSSDLDLLSLRW